MLMSLFPYYFHPNHITVPTIFTDSSLYFILICIQCSMTVIQVCINWEGLELYIF